MGHTTIAWTDKTSPSWRECQHVTEEEERNNS
jgi:hypothetical protein